jgi:hypothetical protein
VTRFTFGGTAADIVTDTAGNYTTDAGTAWTARTGGTQITDLLDANGSPLIGGTISTLTDPVGLVIFQGPDDGTNVLWVDFGGGRVKMTAWDGKIDKDGSGTVPIGQVPDLSSLYAPLTVSSKGVVREDELLVNVKDYGAVGDNSTNDTAAIAAALAAAIAASRPLYFPAGTYLTDKISHTSTVQSAAINWIGDGRNVTTIKKRTADGNGLLQLNASTTVAYQFGYLVEGITFQGQAGNSPYVVQMRDVVRTTWRECAFKSGVIGLQLVGGIGNHIVDCQMDSNTHGVVLDKTTGGVGNYPNLNTLSQCEITSNTGWGVTFDGGRGLAILDCDIETNGTNGTSDSGGVKVGTTVGSEDGTTVLGLMMERTWLEANAGGAVVQLGSGRNKLDSCYMAANPNATNDVKIDGGRYTLVDCDIDTGKATSVNEGGSVSSPNYIYNLDSAGGVTIDTTKTLRVTDAANWTTYSPSISGTGWALGNATVTARYRQEGTTVHFRMWITWGSTSTYGSVAPVLALPLTAKDLHAGAFYAEANDVGSNVYLLYPSQASTTGVRCNVIGASGASVALTSTVPFTWVTGDMLVLAGTYEIA